MKESFNILYKTYIRPHIEYCIQAWSPYYAKDIDLLEKIQHRAIKLISQIANLLYKEHIQNLNLYSLYCRRKCGYLIEIFKSSIYTLILQSFLPCHQSILQEDMIINFINPDSNSLQDPSFLLAMPA